MQRSREKTKIFNYGALSYIGAKMSGKILSNIFHVLLQNYAPKVNMVLYSGQKLLIEMDKSLI